MSLDLVKLRAWWWQKQGLDGSLDGASAAEVLARTGWARSVGGCAPYLTLFARAGITREQADAAAAKLEIHELPSARGCTYVLPAGDFALGLHAGRGFADDGALKSALRAGATQREIDGLKADVLKALAKGPQEPAALREQLKVRSLGEAGKKLGVSTPLPVALGLLQQTGEIRRVSTNGRFDQERYRYALWQPNPAKGYADETYVELARRYFRWIGPATLKEFQWFSGLGVKTSQAATALLELVDVGEGRLLLPGEQAAFAKFKPGGKPQYALVSSLDGLTLLRRDHKLLLDDVDLAREVAAEKATKPLGGLSDLPSHGIFDRGRLIGLWEFDPSAGAASNGAAEAAKGTGEGTAKDTGRGTVVWSTFSGQADKALRAEVEKTALFVREQLGDARSFSLDSAKSRAPKIAALRRPAS